VICFLPPQRGRRQYVPLRLVGYDAGVYARFGTGVV
jgi:hypothetical protein